MANLTMTNWRIKDKFPYINLGSAGENNASMIVITVDALIDHANYYLDIGDESGNGLPNTQELKPNTNVGTNDEPIYTLSMKPMISWLGKEGKKILQVRCVYTDNNEQVVKQSNVFHGTVDRNSGFVYKYDIAVFEEYLNKIKENSDYVTEDELIEALRPYATTTEMNTAINNAVSDKQDIIQVTSLPLATASQIGKIYQYIGDSTTYFEHGYFYEVRGVELDYSWEKVDVMYLPKGIYNDTNATSNRYSLKFNDENNYASGQYSIAEGTMTRASGNYSHAEGYSTTSVGDSSHSEGVYTSATGNYSHSQNMGTQAKGKCQTVIGRYNIIQGDINSMADNDYALIIGNGASDSRSNALAVQWDGNVVFQDGSKQNSASISITDLKTLVASCSDFADFKTQIASL